MLITSSKSKSVADTARIQRRTKRRRMRNSVTDTSARSRKRRRESRRTLFWRPHLSDLYGRIGCHGDYGNQCTTLMVILEALGVAMAKARPAADFRRKMNRCGKIENQ